MKVVDSRMFRLLGLARTTAVFVDYNKPKEIDLGQVYREVTKDLQTRRR